MGTWVRQAARAIEEQLKKDKPELEVRERRKRAENANRICGITHENAGNSGSSLVEATGKLMHQDEQEPLTAWEGGTGTTTKAGGLTLSCVPRQDVKRCAHAKLERHPSRRGGQRPTRGSQGSLTNVRARSVAKEYKTHARPELCASTPPLEALKIVLSEIATGEREGKVLALVDVWRAYFYAAAGRKVFGELPRPRTTSRVTNTCVDCYDAACTARVTPHNIGKRNWRRHSATSN